MSTPDAGGGDRPGPARPQEPGSTRELFGAEIPQAERAWRPPDESGRSPGPETPEESLAWALEGLPTALREIRQEVRRAADLAADALATASAAAAKGTKDTPAGIDPLPGALRELREEIRESSDRATESLAVSRQLVETLPALLGSFRDDLHGVINRIGDVMASANQEAARAFSLVAREVRAMSDRQTVLREEIKLLGKRIEELERLRRRQLPPRRLSPDRMPPAAPQTPAS